MKIVPVYAVSVALALVACSDVTTVPVTSKPTQDFTSTTSGSSSSAVPFPYGESVHTIEVGSLQRTYLVHVPQGLVEPRAVVFVLHGGGGRGLEVSESGASPLSVFRSVADREGFVAVYPEGRPAKDRQGLIGWVDCRSDNSVSSGADDIEFLRVLIEQMEAEYQLTSDSVFLAGSSNGAMMSQAFALHHPEMIGGVASSGGNLAENPIPGPCSDEPSRPTPILLVHGTSDAQMPYGGGCVADLNGECSRGRVVSAEETRDRWLSINGLAGATPVETVIDLDESDGGAAHQFIYDGAVPVEWWRLDGAGHSSPSRTVLLRPSRFSGIQNRDVEFADVAWSFFERRLPSR